MSDERQARIDAAMEHLFRDEDGNPPLAAVGYYTARSRMAAALDAGTTTGEPAGASITIPATEKGWKP